MRSCLRALLLLAVTTLLPATAFAQASIAGSAKDASGATLPGVTVEASSPALIEKVRTTVTDDRGLFRIVSLPPGTYTVTFALPGFNQVRREGIELTGAFTATIDAEMAVGGVTETITVTGASPIVDVQSIRRQMPIGNYFNLTPEREGTFDGKCTELCGTYHSRMLFNVEVVSAEDFQAELERLRDEGNTGLALGGADAVTQDGLDEAEGNE